MSQVDNFYTYLEELDQSYGRLADLLRQKLVAVEKFDINKLDEIIKEEQVYVLLSKGFDSNIRVHRDKLSLQGDTLSEVIEELPGENRARFRQQFERLRTTLDTVKGLNEKCQTLIEERLYSLDKSIKHLEKTDGTPYKQPGSPKPSPEDGGPRLFTKSV